MLRLNFPLIMMIKVEYQISSICDGYIRLLDTAFSDDVKSINTDDFKGWTNELEKISAGEKVDILNNLKETYFKFSSRNK